MVKTWAMKIHLFIASLFLVNAAYAVKENASVQPFVGFYKLQEAPQGFCHQNIQIEHKEMLGFYGMPRGTGKVIAQLVNVNNGERYQIHGNPMTGATQWRKEDAYAVQYPNRYEVIELEGEYAFSKIFANLKKGSFFRAMLFKHQLEISGGRFVTEYDDMLSLSPDFVCRYTR